MKAIVLTKTGSANNAFEIRELPTPQMGDNDVLIKVAFSGLNFADVMARKGMYKAAPPLPSVLGYDVSGTVESIGKNVINVALGDQVFAITRFGGYAEYAVCSGMAVAKVPAKIDMATATALATQYSTAWFSAAEMVNLHEGETVLIHAAAGGVGTALTQYALHKKCTVFATAGSDEKVNILQKVGVHVAINYRKEKFEKVVMQKTDGKGINVIFDAVGGKSVKTGIKSLSAGGIMVCYGATEMSSGGQLQYMKTAIQFGFYNPGLLTMASKSIIGINMLHIADERPAMMKRTMDEVYKLAEQGIFKPVLGKVFGASEMGAAHAFLESRASVGKVVVEW